MLASITTPDKHSYLISSALVSQELQAECFNRPTDPETIKHDANSPGRAPVSRIVIGEEQGILRHYHRGGLMSRISADKFLWAGINRTRAVSEYRLLEWMTERQLPTPVPLGARVIRHGLSYTCDLITREVPNTQTLAEWIKHTALETKQWEAVGAAVKLLHNQSVFHADLNANNILLDHNGSVTLIDFDKCRRRTGLNWKHKNISRLKRSLDKLSHLQVINHFSANNWQTLLTGYEG